MSANSQVAGWIAESIAKEIIGEFSSYYIGLISADLGFQSSSSEIGELLQEIKAELDELVTMLNAIIDFDQLNNLSHACQNISSDIETLENYYNMEGRDMLTIQTYMQNIESDVSKLDTALGNGVLDQNSGVVALANWLFDNMSSHSTSVCELLYAYLHKIWGLRAKAIYTIGWSSKEYDNPLQINVATLGPNCLEAINTQAQNVQDIVNSDFSQRMAALSSPVFQIPSNGRTAETITAISAFTWFGFDNPTNPATEDSSNIVYDIDWIASNQYGPTGYGFMLNPALGGTLSPPTYEIGLGYFGTKAAGLLPGYKAVAMAMVGLGNELCPALAQIVEEENNQDEVLWYSHFGELDEQLIFMYPHVENANADVVTNKFYTGLCEFEDEDYLNGWQNFAADQPYAANSTYFKTNIDLTSRIETSGGKTYTIPTSTFVTVNGGYWDQRLVGCTTTEDLPLPITGVCFLQRGNRWGYLAQCRIHLNKFNKKPFGGATTNAEILAYINKHSS